MYIPLLSCNYFLCFCAFVTFARLSASVLCFTFREFILKHLLFGRHPDSRCHQPHPDLKSALLEQCAPNSSPLERRAPLLNLAIILPYGPRTTALPLAWGPPSPCGLLSSALHRFLATTTVMFQDEPMASSIQYPGKGEPMGLPWPPLPTTHSFSGLSADTPLLERRWSAACVLVSTLVTRVLVVDRLVSLFVSACPVPRLPSIRVALVLGIPFWPLPLFPSSFS